jgi:hypothetical protein
MHQKNCLKLTTCENSETIGSWLSTPRLPPAGTQLGYARVSTAHQSLDQQMDALTAAGVDANRVYTDKLSGTSTRQQRPGLAALLDYAREGDAIVVVGIDRLGRNAAEVTTTIRDLGERGIVLRSLREGIDTANASGRMVDGVHDCDHAGSQPRHGLAGAGRPRLGHSGGHGADPYSACDTALGHRQQGVTWIAPGSSL